MRRLATVIFLLLMVNTVVAAQPIHKNVRLHIQTMPENLDSAIRSEILKRRVPVRIVAASADAELIMKETSGFTGTQRHKEGIRLIIEIFDFAGSKRWPASPGARYYWVDKASRSWQNKVAKSIVNKLSKSVQRYPTTASSADDWWPWTMERLEEPSDPAGADTGADQTTDAPPESTPASWTSTYNTPPAEVDVDWSQKDNTLVEVRFPKTPLEAKSGMTEEEVRKLFGDPLQIVRLEDKTIYRYKAMVVEFRDGNVSEVKFQ
jgi:hypothetical protein